MAVRLYLCGYASVRLALRTVPSEPFSLKVSDVLLVACTTNSPLTVGVAAESG